ncbi:MAG TPA: twin-arginine translocase TatA/TatE family subunit [Chloroflexota bacterium]|nr:twin-arginine translocase TatA/TatE family subunit [Chloroflexota bacterium]
MLGGLFQPSHLLLLLIVLLLVLGPVRLVEVRRALGASWRALVAAWRAGLQEQAAPLPARACPRCGVWSAETAKYCTRCGASLG